MKIDFEWFKEIIINFKIISLFNSVLKKNKIIRILKKFI